MRLRWGHMCFCDALVQINLGICTMWYTVCIQKMQMERANSVDPNQEQSDVGLLYTDLPVQIVRIVTVHLQSIVKAYFRSIH